MTLTRRINEMVLGIALFVTIVVTGYFATREFSAARTHALEMFAASVVSKPALPLQIHLVDKELLRAQLDEFLGTRYVRSVSITDSLGEVLVEDPGSVFADTASVSARRKNSHPMDVLHINRESKTFGGTVGLVMQGLLFGLDDEHLNYVSVPVVSTVSPMDNDFSFETHLASLQDRKNAKSIYVVGYVNAGISNVYFWQLARESVPQMLMRCIPFILLSLTVSWIYTRRIFGPLSRLEKVVQEVAEKKLDANFRFKASGEAKQIAVMLNSILFHLRDYKQDMDINQKLLNLQVEQRDTQLQERSEKLNEAVQEVTRSREDLQRMAYFDSLTGLPNRRMFTEQLNLLLRMTKRDNSLIALLFLDLDNFKRINDTLGHSAGDLLLREVGIRISGALRGTDVVSHAAMEEGSIEVSRLGGDEFTIVLTQIDGPEAAVIVAERILETMSNPLIIDGHELVITPSIGIAIGPTDADDVEGLLKAADTAMYHAKGMGRNNYLFFNEEMSTSSVERLQLELDLRRAIEEKQLELHYQPQVDVTNGTLVGVEALLRWHHPEHGMVSPEHFIPLAEEMGLIVSLSEWALKEACCCIARFSGRNLNLPKVAVNVSALAFSPALTKRVDTVIQATGIEPHLLELELTEGVMMDCTAASSQSLEQMKALGVGLAIDDFGTGYSSLSYLSHFPLDTLKIDRSFIVDFNKSDNNAALVKAIIAMGESLGLRLIAEGVETEEQLQFMRDNGVEVVQGFLFSKPVPEAELVRLTTEGYFKVPGPNRSADAVNDQLYKSTTRASPSND